MDLRAYFQRIREIERTLASPTVLISSLATADGGRAGRLTAVAASLAARMIADGKCRVATDNERAEYERLTARESTERLARESGLPRTFVAEAKKKSGERS
jgi:hypothetical protein